VRHPGRTCLGLPQEPGLAAVRVHMEGRERTAEGDEVLPFYPYISLSILMIVSGDGFWVESGGSIQFGFAREATNANLVPLDQLLPYFSRSVTVAFAYA
jgi:hypothetical protein